MGKYRGYEKYKKSGVEWIGDIPESWKISKARFVSEIFIPQRNKPELNLDEGLPWLTMDDMLTDRVSETSYKVTKKSSIQSGSKSLKKGSVIASCVGSFSICTINDVDLIINQQLQAFIPNEYIIPEYLREIVRISGDYFQMIATAATVVYVNKSGFANMPVPLPPLDEQESITHFLDRKTSQIDALIAKKEALLEKLDEKRTALISHAVTKGLDPNVPMKDSGVEWLGEIPEHWQPVKVRYYSHFVTSGSRGWSQYFADNGSVFLRIANVSRDGIELKLEDIQRVIPPSDKEGERAEAISGDVIISITADLGSVATIPDNFEKAYVSQHLALVRPIYSKIHSQWIAYQVFADMGKNQLLSSGYGGTKIQLNLTDIKDLWIGSSG
jgi:type I restriction enzyme, S subunit